MKKYIKSDIASLIHMPTISKSAKIPSVWTEDEIKNYYRPLIETVLLEKGLRNDSTSLYFRVTYF